MKMETELQVTITLTESEALAVAEACARAKHEDLKIRGMQRRIALEMFTKLRKEIPRAEGENPALDISIDHGFTIRTINILKAEGIYTLGQLATRKEDELLRMQGMGKKMVSEIKSHLASLHLSLAT